MKITLKKTIAKMLCLTTCVCSMATPLMACGTKDNTPALVLATDALDTVFNPFFYTSGADGEIVGQTQIGMLSSDREGKLIADWNEPCVSLAWSKVKYGDKSMVQGNDYGEFRTEYYFALKDNIKFSDGKPLTKDDVLFNLYMYLDPAYTGSNTMYSVKIRGLTEYRTQTPDLDNAAGADKYFQQFVDGRLNSILAWIEDEDAGWGDEDFANYEYYEDDKTMASDINKIQEYYKTSLNETWTSVISVDIATDKTTGQSYIKEFEKYKDKDGKYILTEPWQLFLYYNGTVKLNEKLDANNNKYYEYENNYPGKVPAKAKDRTGNKFRDQMITYLYNGMFMEQNIASDGYKQNLLGVMVSYPVNVYMNDYLLSDVKHRMFKDEMQVKNVSGIEILPKQSSIPANNNEGSPITLKDAEGNAKSYDILKITINGVDPKAEQNFAFTVAPGHYYSTKAEWAKATGDNDADNEYFGVKFSDPDFMDSIRVKHLPLGAGPFRASTSKGGVAKSKSAFFGSDNIVYFEANPNFLLGKPKIKKLRYKVISSSQLYNAVKTGEVDYASPSMKSDDINKLQTEDKNKLESRFAENLGYGYIGVSARYIPNIYIRKAIMTTLDPETCIKSYYGGNGASVIYRPMSKTLTDYYDDAWGPYYQFDKTGKSARDLLLAGGCEPQGDGSWKDDKGKKIKYTFTIAGDSDDHPANNMLLQSAEILNGLGLDITVTHDSTALSKLSSGLLTVWAAAWSSSSDPDMYQVYHKNSQATSTTAWGYRYLLSSAFEELPASKNPDNYDQVQMINVLSDLIDEGRETDDPKARKITYNDALNQLMDLAVEFPTYQRNVYYIWRKGVFNEDTLIRDDVTTYQSPLSKIWEVEIVKKAK